MNGWRSRGAQRAAKRLLDYAFAALGLVALLPLFIVLAFLIWWCDGSPVLFRQIRIGRGGKRFRIWKFRTMRPGSTGPAITVAGDSRITRIGAKLRKRKLDELPQLWNVLQGDMSLVGPRPEAPEYVEPCAPMWREVLQVRPGITDLASLIFRDEEKLLSAAGDPDCIYRQRILPFKLQINLDYLHSRSLIQDFRLISLTIRYSLFPKGFDPGRIQTSFATGAEK